MAYYCLYYCYCSKCLFNIGTCKTRPAPAFITFYNHILAAAACYKQYLSCRTTTKEQCDIERAQHGCSGQESADCLLLSFFQVVKCGSFPEQCPVGYRHRHWSFNTFAYQFQPACH